ncbi:MAG: sigma-54-dependent Fis family transcriptional regulator [Bacteroidetes bacterium]|nr:sigma-54-dependent Fis family transcriptional regulator [Bacteroidota bacterium]
MPRVLVVDDVPAMAEQYAYDLRRVGGFETVIASGGEEALEIVTSEPVDCILLDLEMPGVDGFEVLRKLRAAGNPVPVIVYTGAGSYDRCVKAVQLGAYSFIDKAEPVPRVSQEVANAIEHFALQNEVHALRRRADEQSALIGDSEAMTRLQKQMLKIARIPSTVLILGESGTGKDLVARELHRLAGPENESARDRAKRPFVAINCAALPENLVESELFGHERGAFTGADRLRKGAFEIAANGTLFLDEIGELPLAVQAKLLRVLEGRTLTRVGGHEDISVSARVVAATNRNLDEEVAEGRFREDLLFRLNVHQLLVPPLRDRLSDIPELVGFFVSTICGRFGLRTKSVDPAVIEELMAHDWNRNNVRELRNIVERMIIAAEDDTISVGDLPVEVVSGASVKNAAPGTRTFQQLKSEAERQIVIQALDRNDWHISNTAESLGLADHSSLLKIMRRHNISRR